MNSHTTDAAVLFNTGEVTIDHSLRELGLDLGQFVHNHERGSWGIITPNIHAANMRSIELGVGQVFSRFECCGEPIVLVTHMRPQVGQDTLTAVISKSGINLMMSILPKELFQ